MADDSEVQIRFTASTDAAEEGIANVHKALSGLTQSMSDVSGAAAGLRNAFTAALPTDKLADAGKALAGVGDQTARTAGQIKELGNAIRLANAGFNSTRQQLATELKLHEITYDQETTQLLAALDERLTAQTEALTKEYNAEVSSQAGKLGAQAAAYRKYIAGLDKIDATWAGEHQKIIDNALIHDQQEWQSALSPVLSAWNSQLRGLLGGTESWSKAMKKIFADLVIQVIEGFERIALQKAALGLADMFKGTALGGGPQSFIQSLLGAGGQTAARVDPGSLLGGASGAGGAAELTTAGTTLTTAGTGLNAAAASLSAAAASLGAASAADAAVDPAAGVAGAAASGGSGIFSIFSSIASIFGFASGTDNILSGGLAILHPNETVIPAARGSGPFTGAGFGGNTAHISPSINITAMDSRSVARFFNDNAHHMVRALQRGLKSGAHLPLRTAMR
jgi:hypothetical protein